MTIAYSGYGYGRATRAERRATARRDSVLARYWHDRLTHAECDGRPYCDAYRGYDGPDSPHAYNDHGHSPRRYYTGHLHAPCSRYGADGADCAWWAIAAAFIAADANGEEMTYDGLDYWQGLAVNDSDGPCETVWAHWSAVPPFVRARIADGTRASVLALAYDPAALVAEYA